MIIILEVLEGLEINFIHINKVIKVNITVSLSLLSFICVFSSSKLRSCIWLPAFVDALEQQIATVTAEREALSEEGAQRVAEIEALRVENEKAAEASHAKLIATNEMASATIEALEARVGELSGELTQNLAGNLSDNARKVVEKAKTGLP